MRKPKLWAGRDVLPAAAAAGKRRGTLHAAASHGQNAGASRQQLMKQVMLYGFACVDASLYLDTHPDDAEALAYFKEHDRIYREAVEE